MNAFTPLLNNAALLMALVVVFDLATSQYRIQHGWRQVIMGLMLGVMGLGIMISPFVLLPGIVFDTRTVLLCLSGLFFGVIPTSIAMLMTASYRLNLGGAAAIPGALTILASGSIGMAWRYWYKPPLDTIRWRDLYLMGVLVHVVMLALMLLLPWEFARNVLGNISLPVITIYPLVTAALGILLVNRFSRQKGLIALQESENRFREIFNTVNDAILIHDVETGRLIDVNRRMCEMFNCTREQAIAAEIGELSEGAPPYSNAEIVEKFRLTRTEGPQTFDWLARARDGRLFWIEASLRLAQIGDHQRILAVLRDISERKEHESQLTHIAHYDMLTGLPNRVLLAERLQQAMAEATRNNRPLAVAYLDLDGFKAINDNFGHQTGDQLLIALAVRMKEVLRDGDTLARLGGDEFVAVLPDLTECDSCAPVLTRLLAAADRPTQVGDRVLQLSASLGVTFYPQTEAVDADQLLRQADQAMYLAKLSGKNRYHFFDVAHDRSVRVHHETLEHIRLALNKNQFVLFYQPKVNMRTGEIVGAEALIRWLHPEKGLVPPAAFLPVIEDHPLAVDIGEWVIHSALAQMEYWQADGLNIPVSVNVGGRQLQQGDFILRLDKILASHPAVCPANLELELLETSALEDLEQVSEIIEACRKVGVKVALDDFGTGYSSLTYLKHLSVSRIKIDQSFVRGMLDNADDIAILQGVLGMVGALRREVIAEGVETIAHGELLLRLGCEFAQGYGVARPMPAADFPKWAATWKPHAAWRGSSLPAAK